MVVAFLVKLILVSSRVPRLKPILLPCIEENMEPAETLVLVPMP